MTPLLDTLELTRLHSFDKAANELVINHEKNHFTRSLTQKTYLQKKKYAKFKTVESILELIDLHSEFEKRYWDTYHCCETLLQEGQYITGSYCGNRWCRVCGRIITAKLIQAYKPALLQFQNPQFVTLTIVNVTTPELPGAIKKMIKEFVRINYNV